MKCFKFHQADWYEANFPSSPDGWLRTSLHLKGGKDKGKRKRKKKKTKEKKIKVMFLNKWFH